MKFQQDDPGRHLDRFASSFTAIGSGGFEKCELPSLSQRRLVVVASSMPGLSGSGITRLVKESELNWLWSSTSCEVSDFNRILTD